MNVRAFPGRQNSSRYPHRATVVATSSKVGQAHRDIRRLQKAKRSTSRHQTVDRVTSSLATLKQVTQFRQQALSMAQRGYHSEAIALLDQLIEYNPYSAIDYNNRGLLHFQSGLLDKALADYNRALQINPRLGNAYNNRANYYAAKGQLVDAIADYDRAIDLDPANIRAWLNQGITFRDLELYNQAIDNFELALQFLTATASSISLEGHLYAERGRTYHLSGDWNCAIADYHRALTRLPYSQQTPNPSARLRLQVEAWLSELVSPL